MINQSEGDKLKVSLKAFIDPYRGRNGRA